MRSAAVCGLVLLAGCSGFAPGSGTPTLTPAPVPPEPAADYPPGAGPEGIDDPLALSEAHHDALYLEPYAVRRARTVRRPDGSLYLRRTLDARFSGNRSRFDITLAIAGPGASPVPGSPTRERLWSDGTLLAQSQTVGNATTRRLLPAGAFSQRPGPFDRGPGGVLGLPGAGREAYLLFRAVAVDLRRTDDGTYTARGGELVRPTALAELDGVTDPANVSLSANLTRDGLVRRYRLAYDARLEGRRVEVVRTVSYSGVGEATVGRPAWVRRMTDADGRDGS